MLCFRSEAHVDNWCASHDLPRGGTLTPDQTWRLAHEWYKDKLKPDWRRHTLEEAESLLTKIGLHGAFWSLRG
jgi:carboxypeptidase C (cathepsin A)